MKTNFLVPDRPTLTCMVIAHTPDRVLHLVRAGVAGGADAIGVQVDQVKTEFRNREILTRIREAAGGLPLYITNYRNGQSAGTPDDELAAHMLATADAGPTLVDVMGDLFCPTPGELTEDAAAVRRQRELIDELHARGSDVLMSCHTCRFMPYEEVLHFAHAQIERGADVVKIVAAANSEDELKINFEISARLKQDLDHPYLFLCTGSHCRRHRRVAPLVVGEGPFLCVAERDELAAPVQPLLSDAKRWVNQAYSDAENVRD